MESFAPPLKETKYIHASAAELLHTVLEQEIQIGANTRSSHWRCSVKKWCFFKILRNSQETLVNFAKFLRIPLLQNNQGQLLLKCGHCKNEAKEIDRLCCRELDAMLIASAKIPEREKRISTSSFYGQLCYTISLTYQSYLPGGSGFLLVTGIAKRNKKAG